MQINVEARGDFQQILPNEKPALNKPMLNSPILENPA
jgi:hypothetical protein